MQLLIPSIETDQAEDHFGRQGPMDSVYKFEALLRYAGRSPEAHWVLSAIYDTVLNEGVASSEISIHHLTGKKRGGKGHAPHPCWKKQEFDINMIHLV